MTLPVTINGYINGAAGTPDADEFRFHARRGQRLVLEVAARRLGSPLDSLVEVLDTRGRPIERATIRANDFAVRASIDPYELTVFPDGRAIIKGTTDPAIARSLYARYVGN